MISFASLFRSNFFVKARNWEYWPFGIVHAPLFIYWLWLSAKSRSITFFSASNPGILMGGMFGESKFDVMRKVPDEVKPRTIRLDYPTTKSAVLEVLYRERMTFPLIFKPDLGERGWRVRKIEKESDIEDYLSIITLPFLAQEFVSLPLEFGVFYVRYPSQPTGRVVSIVGKEMLSVTGDGQRSLRELILNKDRARLQWQTLEKTYHSRLDEVLPSGKRLELVSIGNHCLGTKFLDANHLITDRLTQSFDALSKQIEGFYFGRFDLRTASLEDLERGKVMILELNGCGAEPAHIYQPGYSLWNAWRVLFRHWSDIYRVSLENHQQGTPYISLAEARSIYRHFKALTSA
ncbi:MAG: hypothetical protein JNN04_02010 [Cyclobacteriaceae bacterium]|nr:hypothetical protein [Cyclobacteriaceae bacterium]